VCGGVPVIGLVRYIWILLCFYLHEWGFGGFCWRNLMFVGVLVVFVGGI
jgi:hypothetical protein